MRKLFLIQAVNDDGENLDFFVIADDAEEALMFWRECEVVVQACADERDISGIRVIVRDVYYTHLIAQPSGVVPWDMFPNQRTV